MGSVVSGIGDILGGVGDFAGDVFGGIGDFAGSILGGIDDYSPLIKLGLGAFGAYGDYNASKDIAKSAQQAAKAADPFGPYRKPFAQKLMGLYDNPWSIADTPGYQFRLAQGLEGLNRNAAGAGMLGSGNRLMELMRYGQDYASQEFDNEVARLSGLAGATSGSPGSAANFMLQAGTQNATRFPNTLANIGTLIGDVGDWWGSRNAQAPTSSYSPGQLGVNLPGGGVVYY